MTTLVFVAAFCIVAVLVYMARYSGRLRVTHTRIIDAPMADAYAQVMDPGRWPDWSPWLEHEVEHLPVCRPGRIELRVRVRQPFPFRGRSQWQFSECEGKTQATWSLRGRVAFPMRAFATTVQGAIALDFRYALDRLARLVEGADAPRYTVTYEGVREMAAVRYAFVGHSGALAGLGEAMRAAVGDLRKALASQGVAAQGPPIAVYVKTDIRRRTTQCRLGIPIGDAEVEGLAVARMPAHRAFVACLRGSHGQLEVAWYLAMQRISAEGIQPDLRTPPFERYLNDPDPARGNDNVTELHIPLRQTP